jgi:hypothetical protein
MIFFSLLPFAIKSGTVGDARAPICFIPEASQRVMPYYELRSKFGIEGKAPDQITESVGNRL